MREQEENRGGEVYNLMLELEQLESLREDLQDSGYHNLDQIKTALAKPQKPSEPEQELLEQIRDELEEFNLAGLAEVDQRIDELNRQIDELD